MQHFLLSKAAKTLSLALVFRMTDKEAEEAFKAVRWASTNGVPVCPSCGSVEAYEARRPNGALRFRCKGCRKDFSITSGTLFASHKLPLKGYLAAIAIFCNEVKGKSALALSRDLGLSYKSALVLLVEPFGVGEILAGRPLVHARTASLNRKMRSSAGFARSESGEFATSARSCPRCPPAVA